MVHGYAWGVREGKPMKQLALPATCGLDLNRQVIELKRFKFIPKARSELLSHKARGEFRALARDRLRCGVGDALVVSGEPLLALDLIQNELQMLTESRATFKFAQIASIFGCHRRLWRKQSLGALAQGGGCGA